MNDLTLQERLQPPAPPQPQPEPEEDSIDLIEYWRAISKRRWSILGITVVVTMLAILVVFAMRPTYRGTASLLIEQGKSKVVSIEEVYSQGLVQREYFQTQVEILKSDELARKVIQKLNLTQHPDFDPRQQEPGVVAKVKEAVLGPDEPLTDESILKSVQRKFGDSLQVELLRNSHIARISFTAYDKNLAARVPNAVAETFIDSDLEARVAMTQKATEWLQERMVELRSKLDGAEKNLQEFRDRERIVDTKGLAMAGSTRQLEELTRSLVESRAKRAELESALSVAKQVAAGKLEASYETVPAVLRDPLVQRLKEVEGEAERRLNEAGQRYGPQHPTMMKAVADFEAAKQNTRRQVGVVVAGMAKEYEQARANEMSIERALGQIKGDIQGYNRKEFQLGVLEREVQQNRNLYDMFVGRLKETSATSDVKSTIARVVDPATIPSIPHAPRKALIVGLAAVITLLAAAMLALLLDRINNTLNSTSSVEQRLGMPALGVLQLIKGISTKKGFVSELAFFNDSQSAFAESVRTIRTSVLMSALDDPHKVIVITSSVPEEGKTTVSYNLACALGQVKKVLLIDADMRRPKIAKLVGLDAKSPGLADLVAGQAQLSQCVFHQQKAGIHILPAGTIPPNPLELISSKRFEEVVAKLREAFDIVIFDSAPLQLVSDSLVLSQYASGVIYVVKADSTPYQVAQNGLKRLRRFGAPVLGVVLNQLDLERAEKYYGEYSGYKSYRGYKKHFYKGYGKSYGRAD